MKRLSLLTLGHSYVVGLNRRLPVELAKLGWEVTVAAPERFRGTSGDLVSTVLEPDPEEPFELIGIPAYLTRSAHLMLYGPKLHGVLRQRPFDLIHVWEEPYLAAGAQIAALAPRETPLVYLTYQNISKRYPPPFSFTERYVLERARGWIAGGETVRSALAERTGYRARPCRVITLGVDTQTFRPDPMARAEVRASLGWHDDSLPVVGYSGRFVVEKGVELLMRVLERLSSGFRALFLGGGPLEPALRTWAARFGGRVAVVSSVKHALVPRYMNAMDVLCAPSQTIPIWREQFGRMLVEAMASGVPVVASDSGEIPYVVDQAGLVLPEADEDAWARELGNLLSEPARREELATLGFQRAEYYSWAQVAARHDAFFRELVDRRARQAA